MSGTITGGRPFSTAPNIEIDWAVTSQNVANNTSTVRTRVFLRAPYRVNYSATKNGSTTIDGHAQSWSNSTNRNGTGRWQLHERSRTITHNNDGTKSINISAWFDIQITMGGGRVNRLSASGTVSLPRIARASTISSASIQWTQQEGNGNTLQLSLNRQNTSFTHNVSLVMGSHTVATWNNTNGGALSISPAQINGVLDRMTNSTLASMQVRVQTRSGSTNIGGVVTRNVTLTLHSSVVPQVTSFSVAINGNGRDRTINKYVQGISSQRIVFDASAPRGAGLSSMRVLRRWTHSGSGDTRHGSAAEWRAGQVAPPFEGSGTMRMTAEVIDSRGRSATQSIDITVHAYSPPTITEFNVNRTTGTNATYTRRGTWSALGGDNSINLVVRRRQIDSSTWTDIETASSNSSGGTFGSGVVQTSTGNNRTTSYAFQVEVTDSFGRSATSVATIGTGDVPMVWGRSNVGIGKYPENEDVALDVGGDISVQGGVDPRIDERDASGAWDTYPDGVSVLQVNNATGFPNSLGTVITVKQSQYRMFQLFSAVNSSNPDDILAWRSHHTNNGGWRDWQQLNTTRGNNNNGHWVRLGDGTQICWNNTLRVDYENSTRLTGTWTLPIAFASSTAIVATRENWWGAARVVSGTASTQTSGDGRTATIHWWKTRTDENFVSADNALLRVVAIGRWK